MVWKDDEMPSHPRLSVTAIQLFEHVELVCSIMAAGIDSFQSLPGCGYISYPGRTRPSKLKRMPKNIQIKRMIRSDGV